jgi:hypothetical protein
MSRHREPHRTRRQTRASESHLGWPLRHSPPLPSLAAAVPERRIEAEQFVLRDLRAALVATADGTIALSLRDGKGAERISLAVAPDGRPSLTLSDASSHPRVRIALAHESSLNFYDRRGKLRAVLGVSEYGPQWLRRWGQFRRSTPNQREPRAGLPRL